MVNWCSGTVLWTLFRLRLLFLREWSSGPASLPDLYGTSIVCDIQFRIRVKDGKKKFGGNCFVPVWKNSLKKMPSDKLRMASGAYALPPVTGFEAESHSAVVPSCSAHFRVPLTTKIMISVGSYNFYIGRLNINDGYGSQWYINGIVHMNS